MKHLSHLFIRNPHLAVFTSILKVMCQIHIKRDSFFVSFSEFTASVATGIDT